MSGIQSEPAAFRATYSDWKVIKTRKCVQIVFEVPIEESNKAYEVLGGMPNPASEIWCAVARLVDPAEEESAHMPPLSAILNKAGAARNRLSQRAALLCKDALFRGFLGVETEVLATDVVRRECGVKSRSEITPGSTAGDRFENIYSRYIAWKNTAYLEGDDQ